MNTGILVGRPKEKTDQEMKLLRLRWEDNINVDLGDIRCEIMDRIHPSQDGIQWRYLVNAVLKGGEFLGQVRDYLERLCPMELLR
jgi:hypothetical protein